MKLGRRQIIGLVLIFVCCFQIRPNIVGASTKQNQKIKSDTSVIRDGSYLYYKTGTLDGTSKLVRRKVNTKKTTTIAKIGLGSFDLYGNYIYYVNDNTLYRVSKTGKNNTKLASGRDIKVLGYDKSYVYYTYRKVNMHVQIGRTKLDKDAKSKQLLLDTKTSSYDFQGIMKDNYIYFTKRSNVNDEKYFDLYQMKTNGTKQKKLTNGLRIRKLVYDDSGIYFNSSSAKFDTDIDNIISIYAMNQKNKVKLLRKISSKDVKALGITDIYMDGIDIQGVNNQIIYFNVMGVLYQMTTDGKDCRQVFQKKHELYGAKYPLIQKIVFDRGYMIITYDCQDNPTETYLVKLNTLESSRLSYRCYLNQSIDLEGKYLYSCRAKKQQTGEDTNYKNYSFVREKISTLFEKSK